MNSNRKFRQTLSGLWYDEPLQVTRVDFDIRDEGPRVSYNEGGKTSIRGHVVISAEVVLTPNARLRERAETEYGEDYKRVLGWAGLFDARYRSDHWSSLYEDKSITVSFRGMPKDDDVRNAKVEAERERFSAEYDSSVLIDRIIGRVNESLARRTKEINEETMRRISADAVSAEGHIVKWVDTIGGEELKAAADEVSRLERLLKLAESKLMDTRVDVFVKKYLDADPTVTYTDPDGNKSSDLLPTPIVERLRELADERKLFSREGFRI